MIRHGDRNSWRSGRPGASASLFVFDPGLSRLRACCSRTSLSIAALATLSPFDLQPGRIRHGYELETTRADVALNLGLLFPARLPLALGEESLVVVGRCVSMRSCSVRCSAPRSRVCESFLPSRVPRSNRRGDQRARCMGGRVHARAAGSMARSSPAKAAELAPAAGQHSCTCWCRSAHWMRCVSVAGKLDCVARAAVGERIP